MKTKNALVAALATAVLTLTACGNGDNTADAEEFNEQDVTFAQQMIPHHEQAVEMADLAETRAASQEVKDLAADIEAAQGPEIETMTGWLKEWGEDVPGDDMSGTDHGDISSDDMSGMMSEEEMAQLGAASGREFDRMFLTMMVEHHEGAIEMAQTEQADGKNPDATALAEEIETAQTAEIETMNSLLQS